ncbi:MAG: S1 RNA-binding domain-containing protein [Anaerolineaceae bacterium]|nr:S1 RNA-binding domain-containing protein [Anaerolineaceae bacterium]
MLAKGVSAEDCDQSPDFIDEGWWESVLAEEGTLHCNRAELPQKGELSLTYESVDWRRVQNIFDRDEIIRLEVHGYNRGGLLVRGDGIQGFVPVSHLIEVPSCLVNEKERQTRLANYVGRSIPLKVIECEPSIERIVLSERASQAGEGKRKELIQSLKSGALITGTVTNITDFGVFVDLGGVEGLIHVSELSWGRVQHPSDVLQVGNCVETMILQVCEVSSRVALSLKRLQPNPWDTILERRASGDVVSATITAIMRFGAFARLDEGVEGLIHTTAIDLQNGRMKLERMLYPGQPVKVCILQIDAPKRRIGLSLVSAE